MLIVVLTFHGREFILPCSIGDGMGLCISDQGDSLIFNEDFGFMI